MALPQSQISCARVGGENARTCYLISHVGPYVGLCVQQRRSGELQHRLVVSMWRQKTKDKNALRSAQRPLRPAPSEPRRLRPRSIDVYLRHRTRADSESNKYLSRRERGGPAQGRVRGCARSR
ncbi:hypothetical protein B0H10DRAFT_1979851 [Mycena sp. CBHHK59/15]|nr:hypothetical protein B0H10DRAFT_1979805 [Mycena sp. CBHHK59/15]KAJ6631694.1 hypothetical protein B0H10DRAFT_1979851 [Mycena sp. CBHHK59/15]